MRTRSSSITILLGFFTILVLLAMLIWLTVSNIEKNSSHIKEIVQEHEQMLHIFNMRLAANQRSLMLFRMLTTEDVFELDELQIKFSNQTGNFIASRDLLLEEIDNDDLSRWQKTSEYVSTGSRVQKEAVEFILNENYDAAILKLQTDVIPTQDKVFARLAGMLDSKNARVSDKLVEAKTQNRNAYLATLLMGMAAITSGVIAMFYVLWHSARTERLLSKQQRMAEQANQSKSVFLSNMSHEIRTPLTAIIGYSEIMNQDISNNENNKKIIQSVLRNSHHLLELLNDVLDISKIEANSFEVESIKVYPGEIVNEIESILYAKAASKGVGLKIKYQFPVPEFFRGDPTRIKQILINLCGNAIKFTEIGNVEIEIRTLLEKSVIQFVVTDNGVGMSDDVIDKIFKPFVQADSSTTRKYGGTGLGLAISKDLAEKMGGQLSCQSVVNKGSCFTLSLPFDRSESAMLTSQSQLTDVDVEIDYDEFYRLKGRVLLAEDNPENQELISMYVTQSGAEISIACNGVEAVEMALKNEYDLVLMDMQMPKLDGLATIKKLRFSDYSKPIVMLTANVEGEIKEDCLEAGADDFLSKPIETKLFYRILSKYLEKSDSEKIAANQRSLMKSDKYKSIVNQFVSSLPDQIDLLNNAARKEDWKDVKKISHTLKGQGGSFGFSEVTDLAEELSTDCADKNFGRALKTLEKLTKHCQTIKKH